MIKVKILEHTPNPEKVIACAGKLCYSPVGIDELQEDLTEENVNKFIKRLMSLGHESPLEHISFTFAIEGVSRIVEQQMTRHRIGCSYSIQSGRYVNRENAEFIIPKEIECDEDLREIYNTWCEKSKIVYMDLTNKLKDKYIKQGMNESQSEKKAVENARYAFPNSLGTKIIVTMNMRSLLNFFSHRCCDRSQDEIRELAKEMLKQCREISPLLFNKVGASCVNLGYCPENNMSCGKFPTKNQVLKFYKDNHNKVGE